MVLKQDSEDIGAIVLEDGVIGEIRYILRSLCAALWILGHGGIGIGDLGDHFGICTIIK